MSTLQTALQFPKRAVRKAQRVVTYTAEDTYRWAFQRDQWSAIVNDHEVRIVGLRRTGNHAIFEWMKAQASGTIRHLNNLEAGINPYRYKYDYLRDNYPQYQRSVARFKPLAKGQFQHRDWLFYSYEDHDLQKIAAPHLEQKHDLFVGKSGKRTDLLILRDPFNLLASRLKSDMLPVKNPKRTAVDLWLEYAQEFLGETQYLTHNKVCVNYNLWFQNRDYRAQIAQQLDLPFTDAGLETVSGAGGGSSFEGKAFEGKAQAMAVLERWQKYADDATYQAFFKDHAALLTYSEKIFGQIPGTAALFA